MKSENEASGFSLTNLQREILKVYKFELSEIELTEVSKMLSDYLTKRAVKLADDAWDENHWDEKKTEEICFIIKPKKTSLDARIRCNDLLFMDFLHKCLALNPSDRFN